MKKGVDYIGVTICFYCHDGQGQLLLQKRSAECRDEQGRWDCGGGSIEVGETFEQAVRRELLEEYGVKPESMKFCGVNNVIRKNGKEKTHWVALIYAVKVDPKKVKNNDSYHIEEIGWFRENNLPKPLHSMYLTHLNIVKKFISGN